MLIWNKTKIVTTPPKNLLFKEKKKSLKIQTIILMIHAIKLKRWQSSIEQKTPAFWFLDQIKRIQKQSVSDSFKGWSSTIESALTNNCQDIRFWKPPNLLPVKSNMDTTKPDISNYQWCPKRLRHSLWKGPELFRHSSTVENPPTMHPKGSLKLQWALEMLA